MLHQIPTRDERPSASARPGRVLRARAALRALLVATVLIVAAPLSAAGIENQPAPDFALRSLGGENLRLSEHLGEVVLINFWASWCGPCRQEMPLLDDLYAKYKLAGLTVLGVNIDDSAERATEMARTLKVSYPVLFDERKDVSRAYQIGAMPFTVLVDREGVVRYVSEGFKPGYEKRYADQLRQLLNDE
ncbi:MAG TPA: TlpA disulfide reductase family protein [Povalibacter sp.]|uniref:TlpA family protein disulfide reductase n=1 Tax=Povalibacter sp. TaxID=1962978 RepID=UPI002B5DEEA1|nr:TlpA disulfide reductase family protein [Povalibacter sp.]HMN45152.1 TlpA disulfide reductase family protein [Povalibacter sp.]